MSQVGCTHCAASWVDEPLPPGTLECPECGTEFDEPDDDADDLDDLDDVEPGDDQPGLDAPTDQPTEG